MNWYTQNTAKTLSYTEYLMIQCINAVFLLKTGMGGGSDYYPFITYASIASGGVLTGAAEIKTMAERETFGL